MVPPLGTPPVTMDQQHQRSSTTTTRKRVEWSPNLSSSAPTSPSTAAAASGSTGGGSSSSNMWDSETNHMLSYFLSDQGGHGGGLNSPPRVSFATTTTSSRSSSSDSNNNHPGGGISLLGFGRDSASKHGNGEGGEDDGIPAAAAPPPPTPVTQYYYHHAQHANSSSGKAPPPQAGSSGYGASHIHIGGNGGSMATIAEALVNPPTIPPASTSSSSSSLLNRTGSNGDSISNMDGLSPISPASMMMHGSAAQHQEPMLLPNTDIPPSNDARTVDPSQNSYPSVDRRSHLSWLQEINALAKANQQQQQQQIHSSTMPSQPQNPFGIGMPSTPAAAGIQAPPYIPPHHAILMSPTLLAAAESAPAVESEEKRAKRLERNRESARKSRRRKKERLAQLEEQVSDLHSQLEYQRRIQLNAMDDLLLQFQQERIQNLSQKQQQYELQDHHSIETSMQLELELDTLVAMTGPNCPVRRAVVDFQYTSLLQTLLPKYQKFLLWLTLHDSSYFGKGKEEHAALCDRLGIVRVTTSKISSKQIGDEWMNGRKGDNGKVLPNQSTISKANSLDPGKLWPLLCFELSISVDQEDRFIKAHKRLQDIPTLQNDRSQIDAATRMANNLKEAVLYQSHAAELRAKRSYLEILTPEQTILYQEWCSRSREKLKERRLAKIQQQQEEQQTQQDLTNVCRKLEQVLNISKQD